MSDQPRRDEAPGEPGRERRWTVDAAKTRARLLRQRKEGPAEGGERSVGAVVYVDENGRQRRLPADMGSLTPQERDAAIGALSSALGAPDPGDARAAALERLTELRAAGAVSEENYKRERRRLSGLG